mmetsp:Transcript_16375/g.58149  ORF Transcript_16375/g.58149 Transcript_16375/m.58149 type:complete len:321 (+) Transcript_16375:764-1726(+)
MRRRHCSDAARWAVSWARTEIAVRWTDRSTSSPLATCSLDASAARSRSRCIAATCPKDRTAALSTWKTCLFCAVSCSRARSQYRSFSTSHARADFVSAAESARRKRADSSTDRRRGACSRMNASLASASRASTSLSHFCRCANSDCINVAACRSAVSETALASRASDLRMALAKEEDASFFSWSTAATSVCCSAAVSASANALRSFRASRSRTTTDLSSRHLLPEAAAAAFNSASLVEAASASAASHRDSHAKSADARRAAWHARSASTSSFRLDFSSRRASSTAFATAAAFALAALREARSSRDLVSRRTLSSALDASR